MSVIIASSGTISTEIAGKSGKGEKGSEKC
jgi:hypothetical protein